MRVFTTLPQEDLRQVGPAAQAIERAGYDGVTTQENKHDPFLSLAVAGAATERIELHTSVAIAFARSPIRPLAHSAPSRIVLPLVPRARVPKILPACGHASCAWPRWESHAEAHSRGTGSGPSGNPAIAAADA